MIPIILNKKIVFFIILAIILTTLIYFSFFKEKKIYNGFLVNKIFEIVGEKNGYLY